MNFLLSTLRDWLVTLEAIALQKPILFQNSKTLVKFKKKISTKFKKEISVLNRT